MTASGAGVCAETATGADGAAGANCVLPGDPDTPWCIGGNGGSGESVTATGNPAVAYGGNGGPGGLGASFGSYDPTFSGFGGNGGSATAEAEASAASGDVTASATAVGGSGGWYYFGGTWGGDASASSTATSGDVSVYSTAFANGIENPGDAYGAPQAYAYAYSEADGGGGYVLPNTQDLVFGTGTAILDTNGFSYQFPTSATFEFTAPQGYRGDLFINGYDLGPGPIVELTLYGPGTFDFIVYGAVPQTPTWAMMLLGFVGLGFVGRRRANSGNPTRA